MDLPYPLYLYMDTTTFLDHRAFYDFNCHLYAYKNVVNQEIFALQFKVNAPMILLKRQWQKFFPLINQLWLPRYFKH